MKESPWTRQRRDKQHRNKERERQWQACVFNVLLFSFALCFMGFLSLILPKATVSEYEKRELAVKPKFSFQTLFAGEYVRDLELYYADTFPFRDGFVQLAAGVDEAKGLRFDGVRIHGNLPVQEQDDDEAAVDDLTPQPADVAQDEPADADEYRPHVVEDDGADGEQNDGVFVYKDKAMSLFGGSSRQKDIFPQTLNEYKAALGEDVNVYDIIVPTQIEFALPERYKSITVSQRENIDYIYGKLDGVVGVDAYSMMETHADEYLYFRTDHHWTGLGAYYTYRAYANAAGFQPLELEQYEKNTIPDFLGTLYAQTNDSKLTADYVDYYMPPETDKCEVVRYDKGAPNTAVPHSIFAELASGTNSYSVFLHGDYPLIKIDTPVKNAKRVLVVKESFGNAFAPYLISHYEEVYVVDERYFELGLVDFIRQNEITDVVFINNAFSANTASHVENYAEIMY